MLNDSKSENNAARDIIHQIKSPLTAIQGYADMLSELEGTNMDVEKVKRWALAVKEAAVKVDDMLNALRKTIT